ncbi:unnamed protein product [Absidia cylindrospora]
MDASTTNPQTSSSPPRRQASLIRPERQRIGTHHPQYHSSLRVTKISREETHVERNGIVQRDYDSDAYTMNMPDSLEITQSKSINLWKVYCYMLTCCLPPFVLRLCFGVPKTSNKFSSRSIKQWLCGDSWSSVFISVME